MTEEARCSACSAKVQIRLDGTLRSHTYRRGRCGGSQLPPHDPSDTPADLMAVGTLMEIGVLQAMSRMVRPEDLVDELQPTIQEIRRIAAAVQDRLDKAHAEVAAAATRLEEERTALQRSYDRAEKSARRGLVGIQGASLDESGFDPHGFFVYFLWGDDQHRPLYVGKSQNLLSRLGSHLGDSAKRRQVRRVTLLRCETAGQMDNTEARMIAQYQPPLNTIGIYQEARSET